MSVILKWVAVENQPGFNEPEWKRSAALADDGRVFVPAIIAGDEKYILLCASHDAESIIFDSNHVFVPSDWLAREFTDTAELCKQIERVVRQ